MDSSGIADPRDLLPIIPLVRFGVCHLSGMADLTGRIHMLVVWICDNLHGTNGVCSILETLRLGKVIVPLGSIPATSCPIIDCSIFVDSWSDFGLSDLQSLLVRLLKVRFTTSWFDSEAVFLGSLVILGGFVAMGQRVKDICV